MVSHPPTEPGEALPIRQRAFKVAFIGSHGVGKTTLCFELAARLKRMDHHVDVVKEVARACPLPINKESPIEAQAWILHTQIALEIEAASSHDVIVCDRSVLDNYAYFAVSSGRHPAYDPLVRSWLTTYDELVWVPVTSNPRFDGVRDTDQRYQQRIEQQIGELAEDLGARPFRLHAVSPSQWIDEVVARLPFQNPQLPLFDEGTL